MMIPAKTKVNSGEPLLKAPFVFGLIPKATQIVIIAETKTTMDAIPKPDCFRDGGIAIRLSFLLRKCHRFLLNQSAFQRRRLFHNKCLSPFRPAPQFFVGRTSCHDPAHLNKPLDLAKEQGCVNMALLG